MGTRTQIQLLLTNEDARKTAQSSTITSNGIIGDVSRCFQDVLDENYATLEHNFWVLDGQYKFIDENNTEKKYNIQSTTFSGNDGELTEPTNVTIDIQSNITTDKITIDYGTYYNYFNTAGQVDVTCNGSRAKKIEVHLYDINGQEIYDEIIEETSFNNSYSLINLGQEYTFSKIEIEFLKIVGEGRTLKVQSIYFGEIKKFEDELVSCNMIKETSYLCNIVPIGTLEFEIYSVNDEFNALNPNGIFDKLYVNAFIKVISQKDENTYNFGTYFLKSWETSNDKITKFVCEDAIGLLEDSEGEFFSYITTGGITDVKQPFEPQQPNTPFIQLVRVPDLINAKYPNIILDFNNAYVHMSNYRYYFDNDSYRNIFQKLCFGAVDYTVICNANKIELKKLDHYLHSTDDVYNTEDIITDSDKINRIKGVKKIYLKNNILKIDDKYTGLLDTKLDANYYNYYYDDAFYLFEVSGFKYYTVIDQPIKLANTPKHLYLQVENDGTYVAILGKKYIQDTLIQEKVNDIGNVEDESSLTIDNYSFKYNSIADDTIVEYISTDLINSIADYYSGNRYLYTFSTRRLRQPEEALGRYIEVKSRYGKKIAGNIVKIETDLFNGIIHTITVDGVLEEE